MPSPDLIPRARSAETRDEECAVIRAAVCHFITDAVLRLPLIDIIVAVRSRRAPRAVLLGVVVALKPAHLSLAVCSFSADHGCAIAKAGPTDGEARGIEWQRHPHDYMAALIAILEADNG